MPKMKSHSGAKKRFKISKSGNVKFAKANRGHFLTEKYIWEMLVSWKENTQKQSKQWCKDKRGELWELKDQLMHLKNAEQF